MMAKVTLVVVGLLVGLCSCLDNGLGRTPQMGWNSWNHFQCGINETLIRATAKTIASTPLKKAGYVYVNMDDCWASFRDKAGNIHPDPKAFPSGIAALASYVHSLDLKFGLYSDSGSSTCAGRPGSLGFETNDAFSYANWSVDYLKYDNCFGEGIIPEKKYPIMRDALNKTGRPIFFSMCEWGVDSPATWASEVGNSWRTTNDIQDNWLSMISNMEYTSALTYAAGPGGWNDPDMLEVGNGGMSNDEYISHFSMWAMMKAPLLIGNDITQMSSETLAILANTEVIAVNQDPLGVQATRIKLPRSLSNMTVTNVSVVPCDNSANQRWIVNATTGQIVNVLSGSCLETPDCAGDGVNTQVRTAPCQTTNECMGKNQAWTINVKNATIKSAAAGLCVTPWNSSGPQAVLDECPLSVSWLYSNFTQAISTPDAWDAFNGGCLAADMTSGLEIWHVPMIDGSTVVLLFNQNSYSASITVTWEQIGLKPGSYDVRDLWAHADLGPFTNSFTAEVRMHAVVMVKLT